MSYRYDLVYGLVSSLIRISAYLFSGAAVTARFMYSVQQKIPWLYRKWMGRTLQVLFAILVFLVVPSITMVSVKEYLEYTTGIQDMEILMWVVGWIISVVTSWLVIGFSIRAFNWLIDLIPDKRGRS